MLCRYCQELYFHGQFGNSKVLRTFGGIFQCTVPYFQSIFQNRLTMFQKFQGNTPQQYTDSTVSRYSRKQAWRIDLTVNNISAVRDQPQLVLTWVVNLYGKPVLASHWSHSLIELIHTVIDQGIIFCSTRLYSYELFSCSRGSCLGGCSISGGIGSCSFSQLFYSQNVYTKGASLKLITIRILIYYKIYKMKDNNEKGTEEKEIQSLVGKIDKNAMGQRDEKSRPSKAIKPTTVKGTASSNIYFKTGNVFEEKFDETLIYRPKTQQNKLKYENFLGRLNKIVQDMPQQTLLSVADEVLAILLGTQTEIEKKLSIQAIIGQKIAQEAFLDMINVARSITDYKLDQDAAMNEEIAINDEEEEEEGEQQGNFVNEIDPDMDYEENKRITNKRSDRQQENKVKNQHVEKTGSNRLSPNDIDAHWLLSQLSKYYEPSEAQKIEPQVLFALSSSTKLQAENNLLSILNYNQYDLIKLLLENKDVIYYCTRYHHTQNQKQKQQLLEEMKAKDINIMGKKSGKGQKGQLVRNRSKKEDQMKDEKQDDEEEFFHIATSAKDEEIHRINKKILELTLHDSTEKINSKQEYKFKLPQGATKTQKAGYQQVFIPPATNSTKQKLIEIEELPAWMHPVFVGIKRLNPIQSKVCGHTLNTNRNMLVCAPTSAGKTNIALLAILQVMSEYMNKNGTIDTSKFKIVYIAPMKALVAEITGNMSHRLSPLGINVRELTGDMHLTKAQIEDTQVIVSTPEKWDIVTRKAGDRLFTEQVRLLIIDQIHLLSDARGPVLESLIARTIRQSQNAQEHVRIVGLSATLPNYKDVGATLRVKPKDGLFYFDQSYRPVPLEQLYCGITQKKGVRKMMMLNQILYEKVMERVSNNQMIIFVHSRRDTFRTANYIKQTAYAKNQSYKILKPETESKKILERIIEESKQGKANKINSDDLKKILADGIGIHHAGLSRADRDLVEQLFSDRHLNILVSTATLAWGVNLPAHTVVIKGTQVYSPEEGRWVELSLQDVMQMLGRAGRPRYDDRGEGIIISGYEEIRYYLGMLNMQVPLQSQMLKMLPDQLNAQIVLGAVNNLKDGVNWLSYTYFYVRMLKNPKYYSISPQQLEQDPELLKRRVNLIHTAATILEKNGLINYDRRSGSFNSTFLGKISSYYYVKYASMAIYNTNLKPNIGLIQLFKIFSMSLEFKYITVREEQKIQLHKLMESVPIPIKGSVDDATSKISVLLQAHISKLQLQGYALNVDKVYVTQSASRIMRALFEVSSKRGWGQIAQKCLQLAKMIDKSMWSCMNPLRQFREIPQYVLSRLEKKQQFSWQSFHQMTPQEIGDLTKFPLLGKIIHKFIHHVPRVEIHAYAQPVTRSCLKVDLTIKADFKWDNVYHGRQEPFWLFVLDCNEENLLFSYYFSLSQKQQTFYITFIVPLFQILHPLYFIKVISDRWVCSDNVLPLSFKNMILPSKFPSPNQILDLQPLPASNLPPIAKELRISYLNQIQTQVYNSIVNSDKNCFLGAAEGSGKFTLVLFSIYKNLEKKKKSIIMLPFKSLLASKVLQLSKIFPKIKIGMTHEDLTKDSAVLQNMDIVVTTPEAWDILTRRWKVRKGFDKIGLFVVDSLHLLPQNYSTMEVVVSRMRYIASQLGEEAYKIIGLSASTANYLDLGQWLGAPSQNTFNFHPNVRQNSIEIIFSSYDQTLRESRLHMMQKNLIHNVKHFNRNALVFVDDKKQAKLTSLDLVSILSMQQSGKRFRKISDQQMKIFAKKISDQYLVHILEYGIGYIYEGMNEIEKEIVLKLFSIEGISILVSTHKLKWELSGSKAFIVAVMDCSYYDCRNARWADYSIPQMIQMMSLASTSEKDRNKGKQYNSGKFIIMCHGPKKAFYKKFLFQPYPVQSSLNQNLANHLNSSISIKSIQSKQDCIDWITWTFFYRRLVQNPNYYNMQQVSQEGISSYLSELIENTIEYMEAVKCVEVSNEVDLSETNLGIICSYYYIKIESVAAIVEKISENMKLKGLLELICETEEVRDIGYRPGEYQIYGQILTAVHETAINKVHALLLIHLNRIPVSSEILHEIKTILPICVRVCQALVDIISSFSYLKPLILSMQLCQMLVQAMWVNDSKLLQVMDRGLAEVLQNEYGVKDVNDFVNMEDEARTTALKGKDVDKIALACNRYPIVSLQCQVADIQDGQATIKVTLSRDQELEDDTVICPYYPVQNKQEYWWVIVGDKKSNKVLATKRSLLKNNASIALSFEPIQAVTKYTLYALCDSYVGCDQMEEIQVTTVQNGKEGQNEGQD